VLLEPRVRKTWADPAASSCSLDRVLDAAESLRTASQHAQQHRYGICGVAVGYRLKGPAAIRAPGGNVVSAGGPLLYLSLEGGPGDPGTAEAVIIWPR
jgi:hypothetical protein